MEEELEEVDPIDKLLVEKYVEEKDNSLTYADLPYKNQKYLALFKARSILLKVGTVKERMLVAKELKRMKLKGLDSL